ncbi:MAG: VWA domain-containing protein [Pirellulales bacterium]
MLNLFLNTLSWWQWSILAIAPPVIIALYFLKLRREPLEVPSTYLWHKSIEDLHVNSLWQRLRRSILLLLQLLFVLLLALALLRPGWRGTQIRDDRLIVLIDRSASMSSTDIAPSRLHEAKRRVEELIDRSEAGCQVMIISFADTAEVVQEFTDNRRLLKERLSTIRPTSRTTSLRQALKLAAGLANPGRIATKAGDQQVADALPATLYIFSDGRFDTVDDFSLGHLKPVFVPIGMATARNVAVTALSTRQVESAAPGRRQVFARVENKSDAAVTQLVELRADDALIDAKEVSVDAGGATDVMFDLRDVEADWLTLAIDADDVLSLDNTGYAAIGTPRRARVLLVTPGNEAIRWALTTRRARLLADVTVAGLDLLTTPAYQTDAASGAYDLILYDQCRPEEMPQANTLFVGRLPPGTAWHGEDDGAPPRVAVPQIIDTQQAHPLMRLVQMDDILIGESLRLRPPQGSLVLVDSSQGPLCAIAPRGAMEDVVIGFDLVRTSAQGETFNTNWPVGRLSFPTFMLNVLEYLGGAQQRQALASVRPGQPVRLRAVGGEETIEVVTPDGTAHRVTRDRQAMFPFHDTEQIGIYQVRQGRGIVQRFSVNLFSETESEVRPRKEGTVQIGYVEIKGQTVWEPARRETWPLLLLAALAVLMAEWYIYNRRVYV